MTELLDARTAFLQALLDVAADNERVVVVVNDSVGSSNLGAFREAFPDRTINVGIAEQDMVGVAAGLANAGFIPFVSAAGSFLSARATEQIKVDAGYAQNNIKLCAQSPGMAYGNLGSTHHSAEDMPIMRSFPGLAVVIPADHRETYEVIKWAAGYDGPVYLRVSRMALPDVTPAGPFELGKAVHLRDGDDVTILATGVVVVRALQAADQLASAGVSARVLHFPTIKPLDEAAIVAAARETGAILTVEEGTINGGLGGAVAEVLGEQCPTPMRRLGVPDVWAPTGSEAYLLDHFGMSPDGIAEAARVLVGRK